MRSWPEPVCGKFSTFAESFRILAEKSGFLTDFKQEVPPSVSLGTYTGALVGLIEQLGDKHRVYLAKKKKVSNLFPSAQTITKRTYDKIQSLHYRTLQLSCILTTTQSKHKGRKQNGMPSRIASTGPASRALLSISRSRRTMWTSPVEIPSARD